MSGVTKTTNFSTITAREVDFTTKFAKNWTQLQQLLGITNMIRKTPGTKLVSYEAQMVDSSLQASPAEGVDVTMTTFGVVENGYYDLTIEKYAKAVSIEAVSKYGAAIAVEKTDEQFLVELQNKVMADLYTMLNAGTLIGAAATWQECLAQAKGAVLDKFAGMNRSVTDVVGFVNIMDVYKYLGTAAITVQTQHGIQYVKDFMGYSTLFLLPTSSIAAGTVIAIPTDNIDLYYVDPADSDFAKLGLQYTTDGETNLIGFHVDGNYKNATGECFALMGMKLWAEYVDGICKMTVGTAKAPTVASGAGIGVSDGVSPKKTKA